MTSSIDDLDDLVRGIDPQAGPEVFPPPNDPMAVARQLLSAESARQAGHLKLRHWRGGWIRWHRTHWAEVEEARIKSWLYQTLESVTFTDPIKGEEKDWAPTRYKIANLLDALAAVLHLDDSIDQPGWLGGAGPFPPGEVVSCANGLLHVGTRTVLGHTPAYYNGVSVPFGYDADADPPELWLSFLSQLWPDDQDAANALQEWFGYVLCGRTDLHKILLLIGPPRSGKGTIARVLTSLVGRGNMAGPTLASLGTNFGLSPLLGKPLAVVSDARLGTGNTHQVVERLLSISGEDTITVDRKYREPWTGRLPSRFVLLTNELPRFGDSSGAIANRFIVLQQVNSWLGREDPKLTVKLHAELPGILAWALDGLDRLTKEAVFTEPESSRDAIRTLQDIVSPVSAFLRERCEVGPGNQIPVKELYELWKDWCEVNGHRPGSTQTLGRNLRAVMPAVRIIQPRDGEDRERRYLGVAEKPAPKPAQTQTYNAIPRVPPRAAAPEPEPERDGTRENPLLPQVANTPYCRSCGMTAPQHTSSCKAKREAS